MAKIERFGDLMHELEAVVEKMIKQHDMQHGEILHAVNGYLQTHFPDHREDYVHYGRAVFYFGPKEGLKREHR